MKALKVATRLAVIAFGLAAISANAQTTFEDELARTCGYNNAEYCWSTNGDGYGTPADCINATTTIWCPPPLEGTPKSDLTSPRDYSFFRLWELEQFCGGMVGCFGW